jgi:hypothetical protein
MAPTEPPTRGDVAVAVQLGPIAISWSAENVSWAPDVVKDMQNRTMEMFAEMLIEANKYDLIGRLPDDMVEVAMDEEEGDE